MAEGLVSKRRTSALLIILMLGVLAAGFGLNLASTHNSEKIIAGIDIDNGDQKIVWSRYKTFEVELSENLEIKNDGIYHLTGKLENGMVTIDVGDDFGKVKLILDNVSINNNSGPAIYVKSADDVVIETTGGSTNKLSSGEVFESFPEDENVNGTIYSKGDLSFGGSGKLTIETKYQDGIVSKDDLVIRSGEIEVTAVDDGIRGKDSVYVAGGKIKVNSKQDGIKSTNETNSNKGFVYIENGEIEISAGDDGIHATTQLIILNGDINITKSYEGLEGGKITINGGKINVVATDDGINVAGGKDESAFLRPESPDFSNQVEYILTINGGEVYINAAGDGLDSNGKIYINGGKVVVDGPINSANGALDSENGIYLNGGEVIAVGASGMAEGFETGSMLSSLSYYFENTQAKKTKIEIKDEDGNIISSHTAAKIFNHLAVGSEKFELGKTYIIYINDKKFDEVTFSEQVMIVGKQEQNQPGFQERPEMMNDKMDPSQGERPIAPPDEMKK